ncbi:hypothetical protein CVV65_13590 [Kyrpidia spormannii]|uniref:Uncharacterized protein n=1 Tax=Kyrpidia spormannii TaxID=2055160 RepID=A0A2K8NBK2_9BACL|nr:hypothetical protein [Kyrpidia spormannii]ATY85832.1 hypothetical protein CVV65_13590 [Kyrpidia spormannii]
MAKTKPGWFAPKYQTFEDWAVAQKNTNSAYFKRIARAHARYPKATLSELRGHGKPTGPRMWMITEDGKTSGVQPKNFKERSKIGTYWNDLHNALNAKDEQTVKEFKRKYNRKTWTDVSGQKHRFNTDIEGDIYWLQLSGELRFGESIYVAEVPA